MSDRIDRRAAIEFAMLMLGGAAITISVCGGGGGSSSPTNPSSPAGPGDEVGTISANHGHTAVITAAQLSAGNGFSLGIRGSSAHPHTVELSGTEVVQIRDGQRVAKVSSSDDGHTHTVTFN
jgi:hypothetical protein